MLRKCCEEREFAEKYRKKLPYFSERLKFCGYGKAEKEGVHPYQIEKSTS
jgi:hypothetical protein